MRTDVLPIHQHGQARLRGVRQIVMHLVEPLLVLIVDRREMDDAVARLAKRPALAVQWLHVEERDVLLQTAAAAGTSLVMAGDAGGRVVNRTEAVPLGRERI